MEARVLILGSALIAAFVSAPSGNILVNRADPSLSVKSPQTLPISVLGL